MRTDAEIRERLKAKMRELEDEDDSRGAEDVRVAIDVPNYVEPEAVAHWAEWKETEKGGRTQRERAPGFAHRASTPYKRGDSKALLFAPPHPSCQWDSQAHAEADRRHGEPDGGQGVLGRERTREDGL